MIRSKFFEFFVAAGAAICFSLGMFFIIHAAIRFNEPVSNNRDYYEKMKHVHEAKVDLCLQYYNIKGQAKRNGWNKSIPNGYSSYKKKKNEKMDSIGILWMPVEYNMKEEIDWFLQEKDTLDFSRFVYYFIGLEMKKWNYLASNNLDIPDGSIQKYFNDLREIGDFLFGYDMKDGMMTDTHKILNLNMDLVSKFISGETITNEQMQSWNNLY